MADTRLPLFDLISSSSRSLQCRHCMVLTPSARNWFPLCPSFIAEALPIAIQIVYHDKDGADERSGNVNSQLSRSAVSIIYILFFTISLLHVKRKEIITERYLR